MTGKEVKTNRFKETGSTQEAYQLLKKKGLEVDLSRNYPNHDNPYESICGIIVRVGVEREIIGRLFLSAVDKERRLLRPAAVTIYQGANLDTIGLPIIRLEITQDAPHGIETLNGEKYPNINELGVPMQTVWYDCDRLTTYLEKVTVYPDYFIGDPPLLY